VWGVTGREDYEQRKRHKQGFYRSAGHRLVEWDTRSRLPDLTLPSIRGAASGSS
jgi:hypothetical protein